MNYSPAAIFANCNSYTLAYQSLKAWKRIVDNECLPTDIIEQIEDIIIPALEYIEGWEPSHD